MVSVSKNMRHDAMGKHRDRNISKIEKKEIAPTDLRSVYGRESGKFNKKKIIKVNLTHRHFIHSHTSHSIHTLRQIYVFLSKTGMKSEKRSCTR